LFPHCIGYIFKLMKAIATHITNELISKITAAKDQYTPKDLLKAGFPQPLVEHVRITLDRLIYKELKMPTLDWLNTDNDLVREAWNDFVSIARSHSWLPNDYLYQFLNQSVEEILLIYLQPRANLADFLFEDDEELTYDQISFRTQRLTVYKYFASAIPMYMKKRNLETISRDRCKALITNLDSKLTDSYDPPEWLQKLELIFKFFNNRVDSRLFGLFFKDKEMNDLAEVFFNEERPIDRNAFIDILESPENYGKKRSSKNKKKNLAAEPPVISKKEEEKIDEEEQKLIDSFFGGYREEENKAVTKLNNRKSDGEQGKDESSSIADQFKDIVSESEVDELVDSISMLKEEKKQNENSKSLNSWFLDDREEDSAEEENATSAKPGKKEPELTKSSISTLMEEAVTSWSSLSEEQEEDKKKGENKDTGNDRKDRDEEVVFVADDDSYDNDDQQELSGNEKPPSLEGLIRPDLLDLIQGDKKRVSREEEAEKESEIEEECESELAVVLAEDKEQIIDQIFLGAEHAYQEAVHDLEEFSDWASATDYITKKIFERNDVEMDTDIAVKFINQMQSYFNEK